MDHSSCGGGCTYLARHDDGPETPGQAEAFGKWVSRYRRYGLCDGCSAQAAYGHQLGFSRVHRPCLRCSERVSTLPVGPKLHGWRALPSPTGFVR